MNDVAKVLLGVGVVGAGVYALSKLLPQGPRALFDGVTLEPSVAKPKELQSSVSRTGTHGTVKIYRKTKLPIRERLAIMQSLVAKGIEGEDLPTMRKHALAITRHCPARDDKCEAKSIYDWVRTNIRYTGDIAEHKTSTGSVESVDLFQTARQTLEMGGGDCDDHNILVSTLSILNGIPARLRVTSPFRGGQDNFTHTYPALGLPKHTPKRWVAADTTLPGDKFGVEAPYVKGLDVIA
jgi:transglutaminase-like putative cysteine protease